MAEEPEKPVTVTDSVINRSRINSPTTINLGPTINLSEPMEGGGAGETNEVPQKEINLSSVSGDIRSHIGGPGRIKTVSGDIDVTLTAPLEVIVNTASGDVHVDGLELSGKGYAPPGENPIGTLFLVSASGDIYVRYLRR